MTKPLDFGNSSYRNKTKGGSYGYETSPVFRAASSNFATYRAVQGGWNELSLTLDLLDASNKDIQVLVKKESEIIATSWQPAFIEAKARAEIDGEVIRLKVDGRNSGWHTSSLEIQAMMFYKDGSRKSPSWNREQWRPWPRSTSRKL